MRANGAGPRGCRPPPPRSVARGAARPVPSRLRPRRVPRAAPRPPTFHLQEPLAPPAAPHPGGAGCRFPLARRAPAPPAGEREPRREAAAAAGDGTLVLGSGPPRPRAAILCGAPLCGPAGPGGGRAPGAGSPPLPFPPPRAAWPQPREAPGEGGRAWAAGGGEKTGRGAGLQLGRRASSSRRRPCAASALRGGA